MSMRNDCQRRINETLNLWIRDSFQLYQIAGITRWSVADMCHALLAALTSAYVVNGISKDEACDLMRIWMDDRKDKHDLMRD